MGIFGKIKLILILSTIVGGGIAGFLGKDLMNAGVEDYSVDRIRNIDGSGFNVDFSIIVKNPSKLDITAKSIKYKAILNETGEVVAKGEVINLALPKNQSTTIELSPRIDWVPSANLALEYLTQDEVWMDIELDILMYDVLPVVSFTVPVDIKEVFVNQNTEDSNNLPEILNEESNSTEDNIILELSL